MRKVISISTAMLFTTAGVAAAQEVTATQSISYEVQAISEISVDGSPSLIVNSATAGSGLTAASASGTYAITTNESGQKITAHIDSDMDSGLTLTVELSAPDGATSTGATVLSDEPADVVTGIGEVDEAGLSIAYELSATVDAGIVGAANKTVTFTLTPAA